MNLEKNLNALLVIILASVLLGAFGIQYILHEQPCPLCMLQRLCMIAVGIGGLLNIRFGIKREHYGLSLISAFLGGAIALRQIALHVCPEFPTFGEPFLGLNLYTWSFFVFCSSVVYIALLFILSGIRKEKSTSQKMNVWQKIAFLLLFIVAAGNIISTYLLCGWGSCPDI
jgi:disulfide bond formation protein DsbB